MVGLVGLVTHLLELRPEVGPRPSQEVHCDFSVFTPVRVLARPALRVAGRASVEKEPAYSHWPEDPEEALHVYELEPIPNYEAEGICPCSDKIEAVKYAVATSRQSSRGGLTRLITRAAC